MRWLQTLAVLVALAGALLILRGDASAQTEAVDVQVQARLDERGRVEFAVHPVGGERILPALRWLPADIAHHR